MLLNLQRVRRSFHIIFLMHCRFFNRLLLPFLFNVKVLVQSQLHQHPGFLSLSAPGANLSFSLFSSALQLCVQKESMGLHSSGCNEGLHTQITNTAVSTRLIFHGWQRHIRMHSVTVTSNYRRLGMTPASRQGQGAGTEADLVFVDSDLVLWLLQLIFSWL